MFARNFWYVAGWSHEVAPSTPFARVLLDEPIVFYRTEAGAVVALEDRCCHRLAPLSRGRIEGNCLRCMYHGLKFDSAGTCVEIPGQDRIPPTARVRSYPVAECDRLIWIWMGDAARASAADIPRVPGVDERGWDMKPGYLHFKAEYLLVLDNLLDFSHLSYVHPGTVGGTTRIALARPKVERTDKGVYIERWMLDGPPAPFQAKYGRFDGPVDRWHFYNILMPGLMLMESGVQPKGTGASEGRHDGALRFKPFNLVTPETSKTTHYFYALPHDFGLGNDQVNDALFDDLTQAFVEDRDIIEAQQQVVDRTDTPRMMPIQADTALGHMRWMINRAIDVEREAAA